MSLDLDSPASPAVPPDAPAKVARRGGKAPKPAKAPKVARKPRTTPARTFARRIAAMGSYYPDALAMIVKKDPTFKDRARASLAAQDEVRAAERAQAAATRVVNEATVRLDAALDRARAFYADDERLVLAATKLAEIDTPAVVVP